MHSLTAVLAVACAHGGAFGQMAPEEDPAQAAQAVARARAPQSAQEPAFVVKPALAVSQTLTSNIDGSRAGGEGDTVTRLTAGLQVRNRSAQSLATLDYALSGLVYARHGERNTHQQSLRSNLDLEWWPQRGVLQASATISQGAVSAFGAQPDTGSLPNGNVVEVRNLRLAPRWNGPLGEYLRFGAGAEVAVTDAQGNNAGDSNRYSARLEVSPLRPGPLGWAVAMNHQVSDFATGRRAANTQALVSASRELDEYDLRLSANAGFERGTLVSAAAESSANWGLGLDWKPSPRTLAELRYSKRLFGNAHSVTLQHRTPLTVWRFTSSRSLNQTGTDIDVDGDTTIAQSLFNSSQFIAAQPDEAQRRQLVADFLARFNINGNTSAAAGFLRSSSTLDNVQRFSVAWRGVRSTFTLLYSHTRSRRADALLLVGDDLSNTSRLTTGSWSLLYTHRLTPDLSGSLSASFQSSKGDTAALSSSQQVFSAQLGGPVGVRSNWSVALRHAQYDVAAQTDASETSAVAAYTLRF